MILAFDKIIKIVPEEIKQILEKCEQTPQSKTWHPEGNVLIHIRIVYERARKSGNLDYALAALFHDLGKAETTRPNKRGGWGAYGHEFVSARLVIKHQDWISRQGGDVDVIHDIVIGHMKVKLMGEMRQSKQEEFKKNPNYPKIKEFSEFDNMTNLTPEELSL